MAAEQRYFHWADYLVFAIMLSISAGIGVFFWLKGRKKENQTEEYLLGGRNMGFVPVALSLQASFLSAVTILGMPAEVYFYGTTFFWVVPANIICAAVTAHVFIPVIHRLDLTSGYEYFELRFNKTIRSICSLTFIIMTIPFMGVALFAPALAFSQVTGLSVLVSILVTGVVCTVYTAMGGIKAVVWTDAFQMLIMLAGIVTLAIKGSVDSGGASAAWATAAKWGRINFWEFSVHPHTRTTFWTQMIGGPFLMMNLSVANQSLLQRYLCLPNTKSAQRASYLSLAVLMPLYFIVLMAVGVVMFAFYYGCDPFVTKKVSAPDQMVALFMMDILGPYHGLPGLFTAAVFSAALSTVSSAINSLAAVMIVDIISPLHMYRTKEKLTPRTVTWVSVILVVVFGGLTVAMAFAAGEMGRQVVVLTISVVGILGGPILGLFFLGMLVPQANTWGAGIGLVSSLIFSLWVGIGGIFGSTLPPPLLMRGLVPPMGCPAPTLTTLTSLTSLTSAMTTTDLLTAAVTLPAVLPPPVGAMQGLYRISYLWYTFIGTVGAFLVGVIASFIVRAVKEQAEVQPRLLASCVPSVTEALSKFCCKNKTGPAQQDKVQEPQGVENMAMDRGEEEKPQQQDDVQESNGVENTAMEKVDEEKT